MKHLCFFISLVLVGVLVSCGGGSSGLSLTPSSNLPPMIDSYGVQMPDSFGGADGGASGGDGAAGDGAPIVNATVVLTDSKGKTVSATTDSNGIYHALITGFVPPMVGYVIKPNGSRWYAPSIATPVTRGFININLTGLTDKLASDVAVAAGQSSSAQLTPAMIAEHLPQLQASKKELSAALSTELSAAGLDPASFDPVTLPLVTNGKGYDQVLDNLDISNTATTPTVIGNRYRVGGTVSGLGSLSGLTLKNGSESLSIPAGARSFSFTVPLAPNTSYSVVVASQPVGASCSVSNGVGVMGSASLNTVTVNCSSSVVTLGGTVAGLSSSGLVLASGGQFLNVAANASNFSFPTPIPQGGAYAVTVQTQPSRGSCSVVNGAGTASTVPINSVVVNCRLDGYTLGGTASGLRTSGLYLSVDAQTLAVPANASSWVFPLPLASGSNFSVSISSQPANAACTVGGGSGTILNVSVSNVTVSCVTSSFTLGGTVSGLLANGLVISAGSLGMAVPANASAFVFPSPVTSGTSYSVTVQSQPLGLVCTVGNGTGVIATAAVTNVSITCSSRSFALGGSVTGLVGNGLVLATGGQSIAVPANASTFSFSTLLASGSSYSVAVQTQPSGQTCSVSNGTGTVASNAVSSVSVSCANNSFSLGGSITGLTSGGLVLATGAQTLNVAANTSAFTFGTPLASGSSYSVTVQQQPTGQVCTVSNGSGSMASASVNAVSVSCSTSQFSLGGGVTGLTSAGLVLSTGTQTLAVPANASSFSFTNSFGPGTAYTVSVQTQPAGLTCTVSSGTGVIVASNVTSVSVACSTTAYTLGGSLSGLTSAGLVLATGSQTLSVPANASSFTFTSPVTAGASYVVSVQTQPAGRTCSVGNASGSIANAAVNNVSVTCSAIAYTLGGNIVGLGSSGLVLSSGAQSLNVTSGATSFVFASPFSTGAAYAVTVQTQPVGRTCTVSNGSGTITTAAVNNVQVTCTTNTYTLGGTVSGLTSSGLVLVNGSQTVTVPANATTFTFGTGLASGTTYFVSIQTQPAGLSCSTGISGGTMGTAAVTSVQITCQPRQYQISGAVTGLTANTLVLAMGAQTVSVAANTTSFAFASSLAYNVAYSVTVQTQPTGQTCTVANGSGTSGVSSTTPSVTCSTNPTYTLGGTITGLSASGLVLANGSQTLTVGSGSTMFTFATALAPGSSYSVTVQTQPAGRTCTVSNGSGAMTSAAVTSVTVSCVATTYTIGGVFSGIPTGASMALNDGSQTYWIAITNSPFTFAATYAAGTSYNVTVFAPPSFGGQTCTVTNGSGTITTASVSNIVVTCFDTFTVGGSISGLTASGLVLANGTTTLTVTSGSTSFTFGTALAAGSGFNVTVQTQPTGLTCTVSNGSGTVASANVSSVTVACTPSVPTVSTFAGTGVSGFANGTGTAASFAFPMGVAFDGSGNLYVADNGNHAIRKIASSGIVTTLAGSGVSGSANGTGIAASFYWPYKVAVDSIGNVYVADTQNQLIRKISSLGVVTTLAGSGSAGYVNGTGTAASFYYPQAIAVDSAGNVYVGEQYNHAIRKITPAGVVSTLAGDVTSGFVDGVATAARFNEPKGITIDSSGNLYVADTRNHAIRKITPSGTVSTLAGTGSSGFVNGVGTAASFNAPADVGIDSAGNVYVVELNNHAVRKITPSGVVSTWAGTGVTGFVNGVGTSAKFATPYGIAVNGAGIVYVADTANNVIRKIAPP